MDFPASLFSQESTKDTWKHTLLLAFQSLGVVYGHLSIGPLYAFTTVARNEIESEEMLYGLLSFIFWTMTLIPLVKYILIVLKADDNGEGGIFALYSLLCSHAKVGLFSNDQAADNELMGNFCDDKVESKAKIAIERNKNSHYLMLFMAMLGSCMSIANGVLVPAISVSSASQELSESLGEIFFKSAERSERFQKDTTIPTSCIILVCLFGLQHYGTHKIGFLFAPIITVWFLFIGGIGVHNIFHWNHHIIGALSPEYMYKFMTKVRNWRSLGGALLCIAGSEAIFTDLGHFSKKSVKVAFGFLVYPSLILCYMGQTAYISQNWESNESSHVTHLSASVPGRLRHFFVWLSLLASAVGSQAAITATFSIINQCLALNCFPRVKVVHTSEKIHGQVYIPDINWMLMILCFLFTFAVRNIAHMGNAIGLSITIGLLITTCFMSLAIAFYWDKMILALCFLLFFGSIEATYFSACVLDMQKGAWLFTIFIVVLFTIMLAWHFGTRKKYEFDVQNKVSIEWLTSFGASLGVSRVPGIGFICTDITEGIPAFFSHFVTNLPAFHQVLIFVSFKSMPMPHIPPNMQLLIGRMGPKEYRIYRCTVRYGYRDNIGNINEFEDRIIHGIGEFISQNDQISGALRTPEFRGVVSGNLYEGNALIAMDSSAASESTTSQMAQQPTVKRKRVRFLLPPNSPQISLSLREELQEIVDAREHGTTYVFGNSQFRAQRGSNFLRRLLISVYIFLVKNCREPAVVLNIPHAACVEVSVSYSV